MRIGFDEPVCPWDVTVTAARPYTFVIAVMRRVLEIWIGGLKGHSVAGSAKRIGRSIMVDRHAADHTARTENGADDQ